MSKTIKITAAIVTFNEEKKIEPCIRSLLGVADEIIVVDSGSTDKTKEICSKYPVDFTVHPFQDYVSQKNYAVALASHDHVLSLDADERLSDELRASIIDIKSNWGASHGYILKRFNNYCGKWIRYSGWCPEYKVRLWDRRQAKWVGDDIHEIVDIPRSKAITLKGALLHYAYFTVDEHIRQVNRFAEIAARAKYKKGARVSFVINVLFSPIFRFTRNYFFQFGFLDGYYGFVFCAISASMTFFKYLRFYEYKRRGLPEDIKPVVQ